MNNDKIIERLNDLLTKNYDAEKGYQEAAQEVNSEALTNIFKRREQQRYNFGHELKREIKALGGTPDKGTSLLADMHRRWINVKAALSNDTDEAILEECERGEKASLEEYNEVLEETTLPLGLRSVLENQRNSVKLALSQVEALEDNH